MDEKIKLTGVPETMLQTVYARAKESRGRGAIHDAKAEEIIGALDYDFSLADKDARIAHLENLIEEIKRRKGEWEHGNGT